MRSYTVADVMATWPCMNHTQVQELFGDKTYLTIDDLKTLTIRDNDKIWIACMLSESGRELVLAEVDRVTRDVMEASNDVRVRRWCSDWLIVREVWSLAPSARYSGLRLAQERINAGQIYQAIRYLANYQPSKEQVDYVLNILKLGECDATRD